jgi:hypothetical protein
MVIDARESEVFVRAGPDRVDELVACRLDI